MQKKKGKGIKMLVRWRHRFVYLATKYLTPTVFRKITDMESRGGGCFNYYYNTVRNNPRPSIMFVKKHFGRERVRGVEIGVFKGENARSIIKVLKIEELYLIDPYRAYFEMDWSQERADSLYVEIKEKFADINGVSIIRKDSLEASYFFKDEYFDFVYIDGDHSFESVVSDLKSWYPKIKRNGVLAGHDILNIVGVYKGVEFFCRELGLEFKIVPPDFYIVKGD